MQELKNRVKENKSSISNLDQKRLKQGLYRHPWDDIAYIESELPEWGGAAVAWASSGRCRHPWGDITYNDSELPE